MSTSRADHGDTDGTEEILAQQVVSYDLCGDGVIYTNGRVIFHRSSSGAVTEICHDQLVDRVAAYDVPATG